jgi:hypothetical protein
MNKRHRQNHNRTPVLILLNGAINNKIKVLKRRSHGFHDFAYFFLKNHGPHGRIAPTSRYNPHLKGMNLFLNGSALGTGTRLDQRILRRVQ